MAKDAALAEILGPWSEPAVRNEVLAKMHDGFKIVHMSHEKRAVEYVKPDDPNYHVNQFKTNSPDQVLVTYMARQ